MVNLREIILMHRIRQFAGDGSGTDDQKTDASLKQASSCLERYFFLVAFSSYVLDTADTDFGINFSTWLRQRKEVYVRLEKLRRKRMPLNLFRPVADLTTTLATKTVAKAPFNELERYIIANRNGAVLAPNTILKIDHWTPATSEKDVVGAPNYRQVPGSNVFGVGQPTVEGFRRVFRRITDEKQYKKICWINLREEPLIYINGNPYVLRDEHATLRNIRSYSGITADRLEAMEQRLKEDIQQELKVHQSILVHDETADGKIISRREKMPVKVLTLRENMELLIQEEFQNGVKYFRVPVTAEETPEPADFDQIFQIIRKSDWTSTAFVVNCQIGMGRSTTGTVIGCLILQHLRDLQQPASAPSRPEEPSMSNPAYKKMMTSTDALDRATPQYPAVASLLRVIANGLECQQRVDETIETCALKLNLQTAISQCREEAEKYSEIKFGEEGFKRKRAIKRGLECLKRYFFLIAFESYLFHIRKTPKPDTVNDTFGDYFYQHKEFQTMLDEITNMQLEALIPMKVEPPTSENTEFICIVNFRRGSVLGPQTILKSDHFPGCQKMSLTFRIDGAPNFRRVPLSVGGQIDPASVSFVYGVAMPKKIAIRDLLDIVGAGPRGDRMLLWNSLREEPVLFVLGKPFVLRNTGDPLKNIEATGIARDRVEQMEERMKMDAIQELQLNGGRLLLHDEEGTAGGVTVGNPVSLLTQNTVFVGAGS